jgi:hypothetical protein
MTLPMKPLARSTSSTSKVLGILNFGSSFNAVSGHTVPKTNVKMSLKQLKKVYLSMQWGNIPQVKMSDQFRIKTGKPSKEECISFISSYSPQEDSGRNHSLRNGKT